MANSKKGIIANLNGKRAVLRVFCPFCSLEYDIEILEKCECDVLLKCKNCRSEETRCIFHLLYHEKYKGMVKTEKVIDEEKLAETYLTMLT